MRSIVRHLLLCILLAPVTMGCDVLSFVAFQPPTPEISNLIVFGDSLSDVGNIQHITAGLVPLPPYSNGRFSNGNIWVDFVGSHFGVPVQPSQRGGTIYAVGGATTERDSTFFFDDDYPVNLRQQVSDYLRTRSPQQDDVFVIWAGGNDVFDMVRGTEALTPQTSADNVLIAAILLYDAGAREFIIVNTPDVQSIPRYRNSSRRETAAALVREVNDALDERINILRQLAGIRLMTVEAEGVLAELIENPPIEITEPLLPAWSGSFEGFLGDGLLVDNPDAHIFFDSVHPTRKTHAFIANRIIAAITELIALR